MNRSLHPITTALAVLTAALLTSSSTWAVTVTGVSYLPYASDAFADPAGLLGGSLDRTKNTILAAGSERDLRGSRDNAQTFVVSADEYGPQGIEVTAFVMNFESYNFDAGNSLTVELFPVADALGPTIHSSANIDYLGIRLVTGSGLQIPDGGSNAAGTAVFNFDAPLTLAPGAYAWRFLPSNNSGTQSKWSLTQDNSYPAGRRYEGEASTEDQGGGHSTEDYHFGFVGQTFLPKLVVDRTTGNVSLQNTTVSPITNIVGYEIVSQCATLDSSPGVWNTISDTDPENWQRLTAIGDFTNLSEIEKKGTSITLPAGSSLDLGNVWLPWFKESSDLTAKLSIDDGTDAGYFLNAEIRFEAGSANVQPYAPGDFDFDGTVDIDDYHTFLSSLPSNQASLSVREAYMQGDINLDSVVDFNDIAAFRAAYDAQNGAGAFAALGSQTVPEPGSLVVVLLGITATALAHRCSSRKKTACSHNFRPTTKTIATCLLGGTALIAPNATWAFITTATNVNSLDANDVYKLEAGGFTVGATVNIDRTASAQNVPIFMQDLDFVQTANDDRNATNTPPFSLDLTVNPGTMLLLSIDAQVGDGDTTNPPTLGSGVMDWVVEQGWKPTGMKWNKSGEPTKPFYVYALTPEVTSLSLFEQNAGAYNMYSIAGGAAESMFPTMIVNTETGTISINNPTIHSVSLDYYEVVSQSQAFNTSTWLSLDQQNLDATDGNDPGTTAGDSPLEGWDKAGNSSDSHLSELFLFGSSTLATNQSLSLGNAYRTSSLATDLVFKFSLAGSDDLYYGLVEYVTGSDILPGDYNGDGSVNLADYTIWRDNLGANVTLPNDSTPGTVDSTDYTVWKNHFGQSGTPSTALATTAVPEPNATLLAVLLLSITGVWRQRNVRGACHASI